MVVPWMKKLEHIDSLNRRNHGELSINFREYKRLESETTYQIRDFVVMNNYPNQDSDLNQHKKQRQNNNRILLKMKFVFYASCTKRIPLYLAAELHLSAEVRVRLGLVC